MGVEFLSQAFMVLVAQWLELSAVVRTMRVQSPSSTSGYVSKSVYTLRASNSGSNPFKMFSSGVWLTSQVRLLVT